MSRMHLRVLIAASLATLAAAATAAPGSAAASTFMPDPAVADSVDADPGDGVCANEAGDCSLRAAVMEANRGSVPAADTIALAPGTYELSLPEVNRGFPSDLDGDLLNLGGGHPTAIVGAGAARTTIEQTADHRVLSNRGHLDLSGVRVTGGDNGAEGGGILGGGGGGIYNDFHATLAVDHARVNGNRAAFGGGIANSGDVELDNVVLRENEAGAGGGIASLGRMTMRFSTVQANVAEAGGGISAAGIEGRSDLPGAVEIRHSLVAGNRAQGGFISTGGGLSISGHGVYIVDTTVRGNRAEHGGGGIANLGSLRVERSTLTANAARDGAGILQQGLARFTNSTLAENVASRNGGAIDLSINLGLRHVCDAGDPCWRPELVLASSTLSRNTADTGSGIAQGNGTLSQAVGTILANPGASCARIGSRPAEGMDDSVGWNLERGDSCNLDGPGDLPSTSPLLGALRDNGGPTWTNALGDGSPAIDANHFSRCPQLDQRTALRPGGTRCDIGSYERDAAFLRFPLRPVPDLRFVGGSLDLQMLPAFATSLSKEGISLEPAGGAAEAAGGGSSLPIGGGTVTAGHMGLDLDGWLFLLGDENAIGLSRIEAVVNRNRGFISAHLGAARQRIRLFDLTEVTRGAPEGDTLSLSADAALAPRAVKVLRRTFGASLRPGMKAATVAGDVSLVAASTDPGAKNEQIEPPSGQQP